VEAYLNHLRGLAPFDLDTAQRYLFLANDIPGVHVSAALSHSTSQDAPPGGLDLDIALSRNAIDEIVAVQNTNSKTLGRWSGIARVDFNSFTHFGERTSLIAYSTLQNNAQQVVEVIEQARVGGGGMFAQGSFAYGRSHPGDILTPLHLLGNSYVGTFELDDPLIRLKRLKWTAALGFDLISQSTTFPGGGALSDDNLRVVWARSDTAVQKTFGQDIFGDYVTANAGLSLQVRKGLHILGASGPNAPSLSRIEGHSDAWVLRAVADAGIDAKPFSGGIPFNLSAHAEGQWADRPLLAYEEQAIGNLTVGRGYDPAAATGDRVIAAEFKAKFGPFVVAKAVGFAPYGFYDIAQVNNLDQGSINVTLHSVGGGVEIRLPYGVRADVAYAKPLDKPFPAAKSIPPARVLVQLVVVH
jgi:hemolysin activation/secretion protein